MSKFSLKKLTKEQKKLRKRILEVSYEQKLSHIGSCLSVIDIIAAIYKIKKPTEKFILSNGHAGVAWYIILEKYKIIDSSQLKTLGVHPDRNPLIDIHVSTGSLGQGFPIALGMALANRHKNVYCMLSDGESTEGSIWETLRIIQENNVLNLKTVINVNGWSAYAKVAIPPLVKRFKGFDFNVDKIDGHDIKKIEQALKKKNTKPTIIFAYTQVEQFSFLKGLDAHYYVMNQDDFEKALKKLT